MLDPAYDMRHDAAPEGYRGSTLIDMGVFTQQYGERHPS
jgi:hypothetical protein